MLLKEQLYSLCQSLGIFNKRGSRKWCYKKYWTKECDILWEQYRKKYQSDDEAWYCLIHNEEPTVCPVCKKQLVKFRELKYGYNLTCGDCSSNCLPEKIQKFHDTVSNKSDEEWNNIVQKRKQTNKEKYGDENHNLFGSLSFKENLKKKYGSENYNNKEKIKETCLKRYGVSTNLLFQSNPKEVWDKKHDEILEKRKKTNLENFGCVYHTQNKEVQEKARQTKKLHISKFEYEKNCVARCKIIAKYGQGWLSLNIPTIPEYNKNGKLVRQYIKNEYLDEIKKYSLEGSHSNNYYSKEEKELLNYIKSIYNGVILENVTNVVPNNNHRYYELDIYLPKLKLGFDFDGNYWHSSSFKDELYHQRKTICCYKTGVRLAHVLEYFWVNDKISTKQKIYDLIHNKKSFNDGFFPIVDYNDSMVFSKPRKIMFDKNGKITNDKQESKLMIYDTGVINGY